MSLKTVLIDDEKHCLETLEWQLTNYVPDVEIIGSFHVPVKALKFLTENNVDLVFLDIEMPELNGFELLKRLGTINFDVIFATAYDEFAVQAFKTSAIDYLLKPIDKTDLLKAIDKVRKRQRNQLLPEQMEMLMAAMNRRATPHERIALPTQTGLQFINVEDIIYCISDSNYTFVHLADGSNVLVSRTLKDIEGLLPGHQFLRIHHSHLINTGKISQYMRGDGGYVVMDDGKNLNVSRSRKEALLSRFTG